MAFRFLLSVLVPYLDYPSHPPMMRRTCDAPSCFFTGDKLKTIEFSRTVFPICRRKSTSTRSTSSNQSSLGTSQLSTLAVLARLAHHPELENPAKLIFIHFISKNLSEMRHDIKYHYISTIPMRHIYYITEYFVLSFELTWKPFFYNLLEKIIIYRTFDFFDNENNKNTFFVLVYNNFFIVVLIS